MRKIIRAVFFLIALTGLSLIFPQVVSSNGGCVPVYGGGVQCPTPAELIIDKAVKNPATGFFVDNLGPSDPKYRPQQIIFFRLQVRNPGSQDLIVVTMTDKLPPYVDYVSGPGKFDSKTKTLTFTLDNLRAGESRTFEITGRTVHPILLPKDKNIICDVNVVEAVGNGKTDRDESQFCIQKELVVPTVPEAGPGNWLLSLVGLASTFLSGIYLKKRSNQ